MGEWPPEGSLAEVGESHCLHRAINALDSKVKVRYRDEYFKEVYHFQFQDEKVHDPQKPTEN